MSNHDSQEAQKQKRANKKNKRAGTDPTSAQYDKKMDGPNRPAD